MTAILKDLRSLKAARDRGEITPEQYARAERILHEIVEDAVVDVEPAAPPKAAPKRDPSRKPAPKQAKPRAPEPPKERRKQERPPMRTIEPSEPDRSDAPDETLPPRVHTPARLWETMLMATAGLGCFTMLVAMLIGSMTLALTLLVTMIAAGTVWAVRNLED